MTESIRAGLCRPVLFMALLAALTAASCRFSDRRERIETNVALLSALADKLADYCRASFKLDGRELTSEEMGEFYYALSRARAHSPGTSAGAQPNIGAEYENFLTEYERFVREADQYRLSQPREPARLDALMRQHAALRTRATELLARARSSHQ
ncbi:MAG: hypothetical protein ACREQF_07685 [Candidatus Binataceae bacterium]